MHVYMCMHGHFGTHMHVCLRLGWRLCVCMCAYMCICRLQGLSVHVCMRLELCVYVCVVCVQASLCAGAWERTPLLPCRLPGSLLRCLLQPWLQLDCRGRGSI